MVLTALLQALPAQGTWTPLGSGTDQSVTCLTTLPNGDLVAGGSFQSAGGSGASRIARWNGSSWAPLGAGMNNDVLCLATMPNGDLVAGGLFVNAGGLPASRIARWNGSTWSPLGSGFNNDVQCLVTLPSGDLIAGGGFSQAGGASANRIARWNGSTWSPLGSGLGNDVHCLVTMPNGDLIAGGLFSSAGGSPANRIARWNGSSWAPLGVGVNGAVDALLVLPNGDLIVGGAFSQAGGAPASRIARWNGTTWSPLGNGFGGSPVSALARLSNGDLVAGGGFLSPNNFIARWNGSTWSTLGTGVSSDVLALRTLPTGELCVGGAFLGAGSAAASHIVRYTDVQADFTGSPLSGPAPLTVQFQELSTTAGAPITGWAWDFDGNGSTDSTAANPNWVYGQPGAFTVRLTVTDANGAQATRTRPAYVMVSPAPTLTANFNGTPRTGFAPLVVHFTDQSTANGSPIVSREWDFDGDGLTDSTQTNPNFTYTQSGLYTVRLTVTNALGTPATLTRTAYVDVTAVTLQAACTGTPTSGYAPLAVQFTDQSVANGSPIVSWAWDLDGDGFTDSPAQNPAWSYAVPGTYLAHLTVQNALGAQSTTTLPIVVSQATVQANFTATPSTGSAPLTVQFTDTSTANGTTILSWAWDLDGDGNTDSALQHPTFTYLQPGHYTVRLTVLPALGQPSTVTRVDAVVLTAPGDECSSSSTVFVGDTPSTTVGCSPSADPTSCSLWGTNRSDRWFRFVPAYTAAYRVSLPVTVSGQLAELEVRTGPCGGQSTLGCGTECTATLTANTVHFVRVAYTNGATGPFTLRVRPADDECAGAAPIGMGITTTAHGSDYSSSAPTICGEPTFVDRWFQFTPPFKSDWTLAAPEGVMLEVLASCGGNAVACGHGNLTTRLLGGQPYLVRLGMPAAALDPVVTITPNLVDEVASREVVCNELLYDDGGSGNEFLEVFRRPSGPLALDGYRVIALTATTQTLVAVAPPGATFSSSGHYVFGAGGSAPLLAPLPNGATILRLLDPAGGLVDTLAYEGMDAALPPQLLQGHTLFGEHVFDPQHPTSWSRSEDGLLTDPTLSPQSDNGLEWRVMTPTPGVSNDRPDLRSDVLQDYSGLTSAADWDGSQGPPSLASSPAAPPPASGGNHLLLQAPPNGGRSYFYRTRASDNFQLDGWFHLDLPAIAPGERCVWSVGLCGTTDSNYLPPDPWREHTTPQSPDRNGDTGVTWTYEVTNPGNGAVGTLSLVDNEAGGTDHLVLWTRTVTTAGWQRLGVGVSAGSLTVRYGGNVGDVGAHEFERPHYAAYGGVYVGIRGSNSLGFALRIDDTILNTSWRSRDTTGPGCDGNCPPRNNNASVLDRSHEPATQTLAILIEGPGTQYFARQIAFFMAAASRTPGPAPTVTICPAMTQGTSGALVPDTSLADGPYQLHPPDAGGTPDTGLDWWVADLPDGPNGTPHALPIDNVFYVLELPAWVHPPIARQRADGAALEQVIFKQLEGGNWSSFAQAPFALRWNCADGSAGLQAKVVSDATIDSPTLDFRLTTDVAASQLTVLVIGFTPLQFDLLPLGAPTCKLYTTLDNVVAAITVGSAANVPVLTPPGLPIGLDIHSQWVVFDPSYNTLGARTTNRHTVTVN